MFKLRRVLRGAIKILINSHDKPNNPINPITKYCPPIWRAPNNTGEIEWNQTAVGIFFLTYVTLGGRGRRWKAIKLKTAPIKNSPERTGPESTYWRSFDCESVLFSIFSCALCCSVPNCRSWSKVLWRTEAVFVRWLRSASSSRSRTAAASAFLRHISWASSLLCTSCCVSSSTVSLDDNSSALLCSSCCVRFSMLCCDKSKFCVTVSMQCCFTADKCSKEQTCCCNWVMTCSENFSSCFTDFNSFCASALCLVNVSFKSWSFDSWSKCFASAYMCIILHNICIILHNSA